MQLCIWIMPEMNFRATAGAPDESGLKKPGKMIVKLAKFSSENSIYGVPPRSPWDLSPGGQGLVYPVVLTLDKIPFDVSVKGVVADFGPVGG